MYPSQFDYYRADSVDEALSLLEAHEDAELLAGGHSLLPTMKSGLANPDTLIDIGGIADLCGIERNGSTVRIGALTRYADAAANDGLWADATDVAEAASEIGDIQVRNMGTVGGNVAHSDPASDLPAAVLASGATIHALGPDGEREIDADDFFIAMYMTDLAPDELLTAVAVPTLGEHDAGAYVKKPSPSSGYAMVGVAVRLVTDGETIESARIAANGAMDHAVRLEPTEDALAGEPIDADHEAAADLAADDLDTDMLMDDLQASSEFREQLLTVYTGRAIDAAKERVVD